MKQILLAANSLVSILRSGRGQERHVLDVPVAALTKLGFVVAGLIVLVVLSIVAWGYGVIHNGVITGLPKWRDARSKHVLSRRRFVRVF